MQYLIFAILLVAAYHTGHKFGYQKGWGDRREWFAKFSSTVSDMVTEAAEEQFWDEDNDRYIVEKVISLLYADDEDFYSWKENL